MCCSRSHHGVLQSSYDLVDTSYGNEGECVCIGTTGPAGYCCGYATKPDGLCDRCRTHCKPPAEAAPEPVAEAVRERELVPA